MRKIILVLLLLLPVVFAVFSTTLSSFSDVEVCEDNTFTAAWETQADSLTVDTGDAALIDNGQNLHGIVISSSKNVVFNRIIINWTADTGEKIKEIKIGEIIYWNSSADLDTDYTFEGEKNIGFEFDSDMQGKSFNIKFIMGDASVKNTVIDL